MVKFHNFHQTVQEYYCLGKENLFPILFGCPNPDCPYQGRLRFHGFYTRNALTFYGTFILFIQRYLCPICGHTISLLPSFLAPRFQYTLGFIFFTLFQLIVNHLPMEKIARLVNFFPGRQRISHQHIVFYRKRFLKNFPLILGFWGSQEFVFSDEPNSRLIAVIRQIYRHSLSIFNLDYFSVWSKSFLCKK
jgi:transposase-like protein